MPSGATHRKLAWATSPLLILGAWTISGFTTDLDAWGAIGIVTAGYILDPILLSPDLDLVHSDPVKNWNGLSFLWFGYQLLIHRTALSHLPPLSSVLRMFYLWLMTFLVFCSSIFLVDIVWFGLFKQVAIQFVPNVWIRWWLAILIIPQFWHFLWGLCIGDAVHFGADQLTKFAKK